MENYKYILIYYRGVLFTLNLYAQSHISKPLEYTFDRYIFNSWAVYFTSYSARAYKFWKNVNVQLAFPVKN